MSRAESAGGTQTVTERGSGWPARLSPRAAANRRLDTAPPAVHEECTRASPLARLPAGEDNAAAVPKCGGRGHLLSSHESEHAQGAAEVRPYERGGLAPPRSTIGGVLQPPACRSTPECSKNGARRARSSRYPQLTYATNWGRQNRSSCEDLGTRNERSRSWRVLMAGVARSANSAVWAGAQE